MRAVVFFSGSEGYPPKPAQLVTAIERTKPTALRSIARSTLAAVLRTLIVLLSISRKHYRPSVAADNLALSLTIQFVPLMIPLELLQSSTLACPVSLAPTQCFVASHVLFIRFEKTAQKLFHDRR